MKQFTVEQYAADLFTAKFGTILSTRFSKLNEEYSELMQAKNDYFNNKGSISKLLDELSDVEAVLLHIRSIISDKSHEESIMDAVLKVKIREHNKNYMK